jgi:hypothetical protein
MSNLLRRLLLLTAPLAMAGPTAAIAPIDSDWPEIARSTDGECALAIASNGRFYRIEVSGLGAGEGARYRIDNGAMKPIDWQVRADEEGRFARYYLPFREISAGDEVTVNFASQSCNLSAAFAWQRGAIVVH